MIDLLVEHRLVVELKSVERRLPIHSVQLMTYMRLQGLTSGVLLNFNVACMRKGIRRVLI